MPAQNETSITPWSKTRAPEPVDLGTLAAKNARELNPLVAPRFYFEFYDGAAQRVAVTTPGTKTIYELVDNISNSQSSSHFKILRNPESGHYVMLAKGLDLPGRDEGAGRILGAPKDYLQLESSQSLGCISDQVIDGEKTYLKLLQDPTVKSIEVIGYSIGSIPANYLASVYGAKVTNIADLGVPGTGTTAGAQKLVQANFNLCSNGLFPAAHGGFFENLYYNVRGLNLKADILGGAIGEAGLEFGDRTLLDAKDMNLLGVAHIPIVYAETVERNFPGAPHAQTLQKTDSVFKPLK